MKIIKGWLDDATHLHSPNYNTRPDGQDIDLLVIHNISLPPNQYNNDYIEQFFLNKLDTDIHPYFKEIDHLKVSSHFLIKRCGKIIQFVSCNDRAWHAGQSSFCDVANCNDYSIGIEVQGSDNEPYEDEQYNSLVLLTKSIRQAYPLVAKERITGHEHIAPGRKTDPGPFFNWERYLNRL